LAASKGSKVISFEPNSHVFARLKSNLILNQIDNSVDARPIALGSSVSSEQSFVPKNQIYSSGLQLKTANTRRDLSGWEVLETVQVRPLDLELKNQIDSVDVIKIDAEGYELEILRGATGVLKISKPLVFLECLSEQNLIECIEFLSSLGLVINKLPSPDEAHNNFLLHLS